MLHHHKRQLVRMVSVFFSTVIELMQTNFPCAITLPHHFGSVWRYVRTFLRIHLYFSLQQREHTLSRHLPCVIIEQKWFKQLSHVQLSYRTILGRFDNTFVLFTYIMVCTYFSLQQRAHDLGNIAIELLCVPVGSSCSGSLPAAAAPPAPTTGDDACACSTNDRHVIIISNVLMCGCLLVPFVPFGFKPRTLVIICTFWKNFVCFSTIRCCHGALH